MLAARDDVHVVIVGGGTDRENLELLIDKLDLQDHVTFTGRVDDDDLPLLQRLGTVFAMPSPVELQCLAMLEGMASGSPVVAVNVDELSHTIEQFVSLYKHVIALHDGEREREMAISSGM